MARGGDSLVHLEEIQHMVAELGSCSKLTPAYLLTMGNSRLGESSLFQEVEFYSPNCAG